MSNKAAISLTTGLEDAERVTVALLVAVGAAESGRPTLIFLTKEAVRLALAGIAVGTACEGCPSIPDLMGRYAAADGRLLVCPICFNTKQLDSAALVANAALGGTVQLWEWIGDGAHDLQLLNVTAAVEAVLDGKYESRKKGAADLASASRRHGREIPCPGPRPINRNF